MWTSLCLLSLFVAASLAASINTNEPLESDAIIETVNNAKTTWVAGRNFDRSLTKSHVKNLLGVLKNEGESSLPVHKEDKDDNIELPESFDARQKWGTCKSISSISDQGDCGSCWAVSTVDAFSDRYCIASGQNVVMSAENLLSCCCCCAAACGEGCKGGYPGRAWSHMISPGLVTGGGYNSHEGCQPYKIPACEHHVPGPRKNCSAYGDLPTPKCKNYCYNKHYSKQYSEDIHTCNSACVMKNMTNAVMKELYTNGPAVAQFDVFEDFLNYKSGVYQHVTGGILGGHAVRLIGWGVEDGTPYWLVANSWNTDWGDNGYFKILRGTNECYFESNISVGFPNV